MPSDLKSASARASPSFPLRGSPFGHFDLAPPGIFLGAFQLKYAFNASAQASGVRNAAMPALPSRVSASSAWGVRNTAKGFAPRFAAMIGSIASFGRENAEEPVTASTASHPRHARSSLRV